MIPEPLEVQLMTSDTIQNQRGRHVAYSKWQETIGSMYCEAGHLQTFFERQNGHVCQHANIHRTLANFSFFTTSLDLELAADDG